MLISVLGPVEVSVDGKPVAIGAGKPRALLTLLALHEGSTVSTGRLVEGLWGERPSAHRPQDGPAVCVAAAQVARGGRGRRGDRHARPRLRAAPRQRRPGLRALRAAARERACRGRRWGCGAARRWAMSPTSRSRSARSGGWRSCGCGRSSSPSTPTWPTGRHREVIGEIEAAAAEEPLRERCTRSGCSRSIAPAGRPTRWRPTATSADALVEAIGAEPGPDLRDLHEAVLRQDPELALAPRRRRRAAPGARRGHRAGGPRGRARGAARALAARARRRRSARRSSRASAASARRGWPPSSRRSCTATARPCSTPLAPARPKRSGTCSRRAAAAARPTLVVLDDLDSAGEAVARSRARRGSRPCRCSSSPSPRRRPSAPRRR